MVVVIVSGVIAVLCFLIWLFCTILVKSYDKDINNEVNETEVVQQPLNPAEIGYNFSSEEVKNFLKNHPIENAIVNEVRRESFGPNHVDFDLIRNRRFLDKIKIIFAYSGIVEDKTRSIVIVTDKMVLLHNGNNNKSVFYLAPNLKYFINRLVGEVILTQDTWTKNSSVLGNAIAGGIIAGGTGAIVGAVAAANRNNNGGRTVTSRQYDSHRRAIRIDGVSGNYNNDNPDYIYLNFGVGQFGFPDLGNYTIETETQYRRYSIDSSDLFGTTVSQFNSLCDFVLKLCHYYDEKSLEKK
ncbi:MAG: hypothetical protein E7Z91_07375 [Cyanobacteria bacterium SIG30]|nr:hypothetical protein [Cyanobacteria bacterium SIG30]